MKPVIIIHGEAKEISADKVAANQAGCLAAIEMGWKVLCNGGSAIAAVEAAIRVLESDSTFNAGFGSIMNSEGEVEGPQLMPWQQENITIRWLNTRSRF